jgi:queuine/archaeosine tRNA-ribosyltransferase
MLEAHAVMNLISKALLWIGEQDTPLKKDRLKDYVTDSVINYYNHKSKEPKLNYKPGKLLLDSGAFTAAMRGLELSRERVALIQEKLNPDLAIPLDYPLKPGMTLKAMQRSWEKTKENILYWQYNTKLSGKLMPTLHSWSNSSLNENLRWIYKHVDAEYIALGVIVNPSFTSFTGFFKDRQPTPEMLSNIHKAITLIKRETDFKVHIMGMGSSPLMLHLAYFMGADSTDSAGHRRKAAYGKIILPGMGERYVCNRTGRFSRKKLSLRELEILKECECEVCRKNQALLYTDWRARAIHNEFVIKEEARKARKFLASGFDVYEYYLDGIFSNSKYGLQYLWRHVKVLVKYAPIR